MAQFSVNTKRIDPYKNFKFRVVWDGQPVAGVTKVSGLKRKTELVSHRDGGDLSTKRHSPGVTTFEPITIERGITHDAAFEEWATKAYSVAGDAAVSLKDFRKDISIDLYNLQGVKVRSWQVFRCWVSEYPAVPALDANANAGATDQIQFAIPGAGVHTIALQSPLPAITDPLEIDGTTVAKSGAA